MGETGSPANRNRFGCRADATKISIHNWPRGSYFLPLALPRVHKLLRFQAQSGCMQDDNYDRARAVECLLRANRTHDKADKQAWLMLCECWLKLSEFEQRAKAAERECTRLIRSELPEPAARAVKMA